MRKKNLKALTTIENVLKKNLEVSQSIIEAFQKIRELINELPEEQKTTDKQNLPAPKEIAHDPAAIALFSDGGCRGNPGPGAWAFVAQNFEGKVLSEGGEFHELTTNNKMELSAPLEGLVSLISILKEENKDPLLTKIKVITDSKYVVDGMKSWVPGWKSRGWKKADNKSPENLELWQKLDQVKDQFFQVEWEWVKGHSGHPQNEYCDQLANGLMDENLSR